MKHIHKPVIKRQGAMRKGIRFGGIDGDWSGYCKYFNRKVRRNSKRLDTKETE